MDVAKLFKNGESQAVRLPKAYRFKGSEVFVKRIGSAVVLLPEKNSWEPLLSSLEEFTDDFMQERQQPRGRDKRTSSWD